MSDMNDSDIIRKAVELAEGWLIDADHHGEYIVVAGIWNCPLDEGLPQHDKDALAAQLVRQVDATHLYDIIVYADEVEIFESDDMFLNASEGPDRTMNTLRAIVESEVLDDQ